MFFNLKFENFTLWVWACFSTFLTRANSCNLPVWVDGFFLPPSFPFLPSYYLTLPLFPFLAPSFLFVFLRYCLTLAQAGLLYFAGFDFEANYRAHLDAFLKVYMCIQGIPVISSTCKRGRMSYLHGNVR